jgi:hypothetical protein
MNQNLRLKYSGGRTGYRFELKLLCSYDGLDDFNSFYGFDPDLKDLELYTYT